MNSDIDLLVITESDVPSLRKTISPILGCSSRAEGRYLRVVALADNVIIHNAFPDRRFKPRS